MDYNKSIKEIEKAISYLQEKNTFVPVLVEGDKDRKALRKLGLSGDILMVHCGMDISHLCDRIASQYNEILILTDWDVHGSRICKKIVENLRGRTLCITDFRVIFAQHSIVKDIESLPAFLATTRKKMSKNYEYQSF